MSNEAIKEYRIVKESIVEKLKEHNNIISKVYFDYTDKIVNTTKLIKDCFDNGGKLIFIGNGGSAADCQHLVAEFIGINLPAIALTSNTSNITAIANDFGYENIFSRQLEPLVNDKDLLIAISTSGNSSNILACIETAKPKNIKIIGMTGRSGGKLKYMLDGKDDILINIPSDNTQRIQESYMAIGHIIFEILRDDIKNDNK